MNNVISFEQAKKNLHKKEAAAKQVKKVQQDILFFMKLLKLARDTADSLTLLLLEKPEGY